MWKCSSHRECPSVRLPVASTELESRRESTGVIDEVFARTHGFQFDLGQRDMDAVGDRELGCHPLKVYANGVKHRSNRCGGSEEIDEDAQREYRPGLVAADVVVEFPSFRLERRLKDRI